jgi:hypothetical protein
MDEDEQFNQVFGEHTGISIKGINDINDIRRLRRVKEFYLQAWNARKFTDLAWRFLGRYIANNSHLTRVNLSKCDLTDQQMASLFSELTHSNSLKQLDLDDNVFGIEGLRSMAPFLRNSPNLSVLPFYNNNNFNSECFAVLIQALHGGPLGGRSLEKLFIDSNNLTDISALDRYNLPNLQTLHFGDSNIGREGCITISYLLQQEGSTLNYLNVANTGMGDEEAALLAASLENNTKLRSLYLNGNSITERGSKAFLKLLVDVSSVESTYNSNHTLTNMLIPTGADSSMLRHINSVLQLNNRHHSSDYLDSHTAGRAKVIHYQLSSQNREEMCHLQGIEYCSIVNLFSDIKSTLLLRILALIRRCHGHNEFYQALVPMVPDLMSCVDTGGMMKDLMVKNEAQAGTLTQQANALMQQASALMQQASVITAKNDQFRKRLAAREESGDSRHSTPEEDRKTAAGSGKKRQRSDDKE